MSVFDEYRKEAWPCEYKATLRIRTLAGGIPRDPKTMEAWIRSKIEASDDTIRAMVAETVVDMGLAETAGAGGNGKAANGQPPGTTATATAVAEPEPDPDLASAAIKAIAEQKVNGFKRDEKGLFIEGRQVKAAIKEACSAAADTDKLPLRGLGLNSRKGILSFVAEHVAVQDDRVYLKLGDRYAQGDDVKIEQRFTSTFRGTGITREEVLENVEISFTVLTDFVWKKREWAMLWLTGAEQGIGASRSQSYGRYEVIGWEPVRTGGFQAKRRRAQD